LLYAGKSGERDRVGFYGDSAATPVGR
jgi:hypothetical protein